MVSLIRIFKVYIFVNDDVIARMQADRNRLTHFVRSNEATNTCSKYEITARFQFNANQFGVKERGRHGEVKLLFDLSSAQFPHKSQSISNIFSSQLTR